MKRMLQIMSLSVATGAWHTHSVWFGKWIRYSLVCFSVPVAYWVYSHQEVRFYCPSCVPGHVPHAAIEMRGEMWLARGREWGRSMVESQSCCVPSSQLQSAWHTGQFLRVCSRDKRSRGGEELSVWRRLAGDSQEELLREDGMDSALCLQ